MYHCWWEMPSGLNRLDYVHKMTSQDPHDAIQAATRVLSGKCPKVSVMPALANTESKERANEVEQILKWHLKRANSRRSTKIETDVVQSALIYDAVALTVTDLDYQLKLAEALKSAGQNRIKAAKSKGRFLVTVYNPIDVHTLRSTYGTEMVVLKQKRLASEVLYEWGTEANKHIRLQELAKEGKSVEYNDVTDYEDRYVYVVESERDTDVMNIWGPDRHELDFMPWVAIMGGSDLEAEEGHKYHPILYPLYQSGSWETDNILWTVTATESIVQAFKKDTVVTGIEAPEIDYTNPDGVMLVPPGTETKQFAKSGLDPAKMQMMDRLESAIERSTVSRILQGGEPASGTAFAAWNLATQSAIGALKPPKELAEASLNEMFALMLRWTALTGVPLTAMGDFGKGATDAGMVYSVEPDEIDLENLYIETELIPSLPVDKIQQANTANLLVPLGYPKEYALDDMGVDNPQLALKISYLEQLKEFIFQQTLQKMAMQQEQEMQAAAMQEQQGGLPPDMAAMMQGMQGGMGGEEPMQGPFMEGQGYNPAFGGQVPALSQPGMTRETVNGVDFAGNPIMEGEL
jgi:hypothetical protein